MLTRSSASALQAQSTLKRKSGSPAHKRLAPTEHLRIQEVTVPAVLVHSPRVQVRLLPRQGSNKPIRSPTMIPLRKVCQSCLTLKMELSSLNVAP